MCRGFFAVLWIGVSILIAGAGADADAGAGAETGADAGVGADADADAGAGADALLYKTTVVGWRPVTAASSTVVRDLDLALRPRARPADILQVTPGLFVIQHAGGGKANQYFLRGFDADHGTDVALFVDGVPVNLVSHAHGQGYADLHWLIPEIVDRVEVYKGPYFAALGNFATAGAVNVVTRGADDDHSASIGAGSFRTFRTLLTASPKDDGWRALVAAEVYASDGPFKAPEGLERYNLFAKWTRDLLPRAQVSLALTSYAGGWNSSGQIPLREVAAGRLDPFGSVDPTEGGASQRHSLVAQIAARPNSASEFALTAYLALYKLALYSNFTFFSRDAVNGDMIEQSDSRTEVGMKTSYKFARRAGDIFFQTTFGVEMRHDALENSLYNARARERLTSVVDAQIKETSLAAYVQEEISWAHWLRTVFGLRSDLFVFDVADMLEDRATTGTKTSGVRHAGFASPKASVIVSPLDALDIFLNFGMGFHSNDARGVVRGTTAASPLTRAIGYEIGVRTRLLDRLDLAGAFFVLDLDSETVWVGDEGTTEARGATRRLGGEVEMRLKILPWLVVDADATLTNATYTSNAGNGNAVALAPTFMLSAGISARHRTGIYGRLGLVHIADRPATEDQFFTAQGFSRVDLTLGYRHKRFDVNVAVQNFFNASWREAQFGNVSRLATETSAANCPVGTRAVSEAGSFRGCEDLHFTPGAPFSIQATATLFF